MSNIKSLTEADVAGERVLCRVDFNVPLADGVVSDDTRIRASLPTIQFLMDHGAKVILCCHLGRPDGMGYQEEYSLAPVAKRLAQILGKPVTFIPEIVGKPVQQAIDQLECGDVALLENLRFDKREKKNDPEFAQLLASLADIYVDDAFGAAHRAHASIEKIASYLPAYAGLLMEEEVRTLTEMLENPERPFVAILGGSKVSDKVAIIDSLIDKCDTLIIGGGMCFTFLAAEGYTVGTSLMEADWVERAGAMLEKAHRKGVSILLPQDVLCADAFANDAVTQICTVSDIPDDMMGLDIGPKTVEVYADAVASAKTVFWNGPMGVFEMPSFEAGTKGVALAVAANKDAETVIGGGDSVAAVNKFDLADQMTFISTGGGAAMELVQGEALPGVEVLKW